MDRGTAWLDTGTFDSLSDASEFVRVIEKRQDTKIGCIEEVAYRMGFINSEQLGKLATRYIKSGYGKYLQKLIVYSLNIINYTCAVLRHIYFCKKCGLRN